MLKTHCLSSAEPIMCSAPETGEGLYMFGSGGKFYIWNQMNEEVWEITKSRDLKEILDLMHQKQLGGLKLKAV
jgi:hypothetical protein